MGQILDILDDIREKEVTETGKTILVPISKIWKNPDDAAEILEEDQRIIVKTFVSLFASNLGSLVLRKCTNHFGILIPRINLHGKIVDYENLD